VTSTLEEEDQGKGMGMGFMGGEMAQKVAKSGYLSDDV